MRSSLQDVFVSLKAILQPYASQHGFIPSESDGRFAIASATKTDRIGRPLFIAAVEVNKRYVSYHLMPIYMNPTLLAAVSPELRKRMQGKSCFNFTKVDEPLFRELQALTARALATMKSAGFIADAINPT